MISSLTLARFFAVSVTIAGPILLVLARADFDFIWTKFPEKTLLSAPSGLIIFGQFSFVISFGLLCLGSPVLRTVALGVSCVFFSFLAIFVSFPILFGVGEACRTWLSLTAILLLAVPSAALFAFRMRYEAPYPAALMFTIHLIVAGAAFLLGSALPISNQCGALVGTETQVFASWPVLLSLLPYVILVTYGVLLPVSFRRCLIALLLSCAPVYAIKAAADVDRGFGWKAAIWPVRVPVEFESALIRHPRWEAASRGRANEAFRLGEASYRPQRNHRLNYDRTRRTPDRLLGVQLYLLPEDIDLPELQIPSMKSIELHVFLTGPGPERPLLDGPYLSFRFRDLSIRAIAPRTKSINAERARDTIIAYLEQITVKQ